MFDTHGTTNIFGQHVQSSVARQKLYTAPNYFRLRGRQSPSPRVFHRIVNITSVRAHWYVCRNVFSLPWLPRLGLSAIDLTTFPSKFDKRPGKSYPPGGGFNRVSPPLPPEFQQRLQMCSRFAMKTCPLFRSKSNRKQTSTKKWKRTIKDRH